MIIFTTYDDPNADRGTSIVSQGCTVRPNLYIPPAGHPNSRRRAPPDPATPSTGVGAGFRGASVSSHITSHAVRMPFLPLVYAALAAAGGCQQIHDRFGGAKTAFNGDSALAYVKPQLAFGPRVPGTPAHEKEADWIIAQKLGRT